MGRRESRRGVDRLDDAASHEALTLKWNTRSTNGYTEGMSRPARTNTHASRFVLTMEETTTC